MPKDELDRLDEEFFVGYLPIPARTRKRMVATAVAVLCTMVALAALAALFQRHPGLALERSERGEFHGRYVQSPYPHLRYLDEEAGSVSALMVRGHKAGLGETFSHLDGERIVVSGQMFHRAGASLLVVYSSPEREEPDGEDAASQDAVSPDAASQEAASPEPRRVTLRGEVADSKCYFGQMRPGDGQAHRACAQLCVRGGIPPLLVTQDGEGGETPYILTGELADAEAIIPFLGEAVIVEGEFERRSGLWLLHVDALRRR
ncbi:MAG: hypothetical protein ACI9KE_001158 [Polyangiales bacterium]|jgi:hypothetical protein